MDYLHSGKYRSLCKVLRTYVKNGCVSKFQSLVDFLPNQAETLTATHLELLYALSNSSSLFSKHADPIFYKGIHASFSDILRQISRNKIHFNVESNINQYFQATYHLVNSLVILGINGDKGIYDKVTDQLILNLEVIREELSKATVDDNEKLIYYFVLFGYLFAFSHNPKFMVLYSNEAHDPSELKLFNLINGIIDNHPFLNQLESIIANSLVIPLNESSAYFSNGSGSANYKLLLHFNLNFFRVFGKNNRTTEFSSLLFLKYLNLVKLNLILYISKIPVSNIAQAKESIIETLVSLRSKELDTKEARTSQNKEKPIDHLNIDDIASSTGSFSDVSTASVETYLKSNDLSKAESGLLSQISAQSLEQLSTFQNGTNFIILSSSNRIDLIFENKSLILEILSCLYFLKSVSYEFIHKNLLVKNLIINYTSASGYSSLVDGHIADNISNSGFSSSYLLSNSVPSTATSNSEFIDNNELINPSLSFNIFGLLSLLSMENSTTSSGESNNEGSYENLCTIINKKISFLIFNNPGLKFTKVLKKSLRCIALAYKYSSQDSIVGLIYSLINMLSVENADESGLTSRESEVKINASQTGTVSRSIAGTLRAPRLTKSDINALKSSGGGLEASPSKRAAATSSISSASSVLNDTSFAHSTSVLKNVDMTKTKDTSMSQIERIFSNSIKSIIELCNNYHQEEITMLVMTVLVQKFRISGTPIVDPSKSMSSNALVGSQDPKNSKTVSDLLSLTIVKNLCNLTKNLHDDSKNFQLLMKTYSNFLNHSISKNHWVLIEESINSYCKIAKILKNNFYLFSKDDSASSTGYWSIPPTLVPSSGNKFSSLYSTNKRLIYDLTSAYVNENYKIFLHEVLNSMISKGDNINSLEDNSHHRSHSEISEVAKKIEIYLKPLAMLLPSPFENESCLAFSNDRIVKRGNLVIVDEVSVGLFRNLWFNMVVHGMNIDLLPLLVPSLSSSIEMPKASKGKKAMSPTASATQWKSIKYLKIIAFNSPPLASKLSWSHNENLLELNTVLRRGSSHSNVRFQKSVLETIVDNGSGISGDVDLEKSIISTLDTENPASFRGKISSTPKLMFLAATIFLEFFRIESGDFHKVLLYFSDPSIKLSSLEKDMKYITYEILSTYMLKINLNFNSVNDVPADMRNSQELHLPIVNLFTINQISAQVNEMLTLTCATNSFLQSIAVKCCDLLLSKVPGVLCNQESFTLFKLLDLLNLLFSSIVNYEKQRYTPVLEYSLPTYGLNSTTNCHDITSFEKIILLDSLEWRKDTFGKLQVMAKQWILRAINNSEQVVKNLLQSYVVINSNISSTASSQLYSTIKHYKSDSSVNMGVSFAVEMCKNITTTDKEIYNIVNSTYLSFPSSSKIDTLSDFLINYNISADLSDIRSEYNASNFKTRAAKLRKKIDELSEGLENDRKLLSAGKNSSRHHVNHRNNNIIHIIDDISNFLSILKNSRKTAQNQKEIEQYEAEFVKYLIEIPFKVFNCDILKYCISNWLIVSTNNTELQFLIFNEILKHFQQTIVDGKGLFNNHHGTNIQFLPEYKEMEYAPSNKQEANHFASLASESFKIHLLLIRLIQSLFHSSTYQSNNSLKNFNSFIMFVLKNFLKISSHPFSRLLRFEIVKLSLDILSANLSIRNAKISDGVLQVKNSVTFHNFFSSFANLIMDASLNWFKQRKIPPFGDNLLKIMADFDILIDVANTISRLNLTGDNDLVLKKKMLLVFLNDEINSMSIWLNPLGENKSISKEYDFNYANNLVSSGSINEKFLMDAYELNPVFAVNIVLRIVNSGVAGSGGISYKMFLKKLLLNDGLSAINCPDAIAILLDVDLYDHQDQHILTNESATNSNPLKHLLYWDPVSPIDAINLFLPPFGENPFVLQYAMKSLISHEVNVTFFYVPQIVQMLRYDSEGYVQKFILEMAQISQLFAHQIIWNMLANSYKDDEGTIEDDLKPKLDEVKDLMTKSFSPVDFAYYEKEFSFFKEITGISAKLKPYIKKTKAEKKLKIDEEMRKIKVEPGVYLPSNPDGILVDINRTSGKPLQSHAKAPFMATFKISKKVHVYDEDSGDDDIAINIEDADGVKNDDNVNTTIVETWKSAIFKVGDDCRQDVLALQLISVFRSIWTNNNLDLYVFPNRVTATDAGCGIIDVLPNSVSRDMLGREAVNGLYEYFITKFGPEYSTEFQVARNNLIKSLAAYSIISYLLQFKDRHNGNIMYDDQGHILHIDFGFCFDIVPGGVKFEAVPFKLTKEMILVMGGSNDTQSFKRFEELCVQGYLAARPYMDVIVKNVLPMLNSGLPCFKGMTTIKNLKARFVPGKTEKEAALYMRKLIRKSYESFFTKGYDEFQRITNGIPY
ncbi:1-phosphatidylinositol 4-kinase [Saccharomycopsis crataegensis]|uniref:1-phosphatidylinositol 4-kinase n=1 Tax=Saccharomycopsis crataegensis TaxID=43959 RepID=A0AAV5QWW0_9ASCO|nr:1-phosphatidylinositol 4-kinase [Saccharomycopsis crataegensis]